MAPLSQSLWTPFPIRVHSPAGSVRLVRCLPNRRVSRLLSACHLRTNQSWSRLTSP